MGRMTRTVSEGGVVVDAKRIVNAACSLNGDKERTRAFMILAGLSSSSWEHKILEAFFDVPSVSAVRLLKKASEQGSPIYTISNANITALLPQLQVSAEVKADITNAINIGRKVLVSLNNVTLNNWSGVGYIIIDPANGDAVYMINGGLAGGQTSISLIMCFKRHDVVDCALTYFYRNKAVKTARAYINTPYFWSGYTDPDQGFDCSGFVHYIFQSIKPLTDTVKKNAKQQYEYCGLKGWLRPWDERLPGDIMWRADLKHVGIYGGLNTIKWPLPAYPNTEPDPTNEITCESVIHASGRPCERIGECGNTECVNGNPPCGTFRRVIESPFSSFYTKKVPEIKEQVGRPR